MICESKESERPVASIADMYALLSINIIVEKMKNILAANSTAT